MRWSMAWLFLLFHFIPASAQSGKSQPTKVEFTQESDPAITFRFSSPDTPYLKKMQHLYPLQQLISQARTDLEKIVILAHWVHGRWKHNGMNTPTKSDAISILEQAAEGKRFRCVEYSTVLTASLNAVNIPARSLSLKTSDMETRLSGAGHVVTEAYLHDLKKWILVDGQWDAVVMLDDQPLNAVELQRAQAAKKPLKIHSLSTDNQRYLNWISPYLYYFDTSLDQRYDVTRDEQRLMLVPMGARKPRVFQLLVPLNHVKYVHSEQVFYQTPVVPVLTK